MKATALVLFCAANLTSLARAGEKQENDSLALDVAAIDRGRILAAADAAMKAAPISIANLPAENSPGGPNDFYSNADYWWPNPAKPGGFPYVQRDGRSNPGNFNRHRMAMRDLRDAVAALGAAYKITGDERYARKAAELLRVFFIDKQTRMNPNLKLAQVVAAGPRMGDGRPAGIIDGLHLAEIPLAIAALREVARDVRRNWLPA